MASRPTHDVLATVGEYTAADGTKKKSYQKCGKLFTYDDGGMSLKLDVVPVGPGWSGWLSIFKIRPHDAPADHDDKGPF